jgi:PTS system cellobiose-specific IIA component
VTIGLNEKQYDPAELEQIVMELISKGGEGHSLALESIQLAKQGKFEQAEITLRKSGEAVSEAHNKFFDILSEEASGEKRVEVTILVAHALDHIMNAMTISELASEFIDLYRQRYQTEERG